MKKVVYNYLSGKEKNPIKIIENELEYYKTLKKAKAARDKYSGKNIVKITLEVLKK